MTRELPRDHPFPDAQGSVIYSALITSFGPARAEVIMANLSAVGIRDGGLATAFHICHGQLPIMEYSASDPARARELAERMGLFASDSSEAG